MKQNGRVRSVPGEVTKHVIYGGLVRVPIAGKRHHDQGNSYKEQHLIEAGLQFQRVVTAGSMPECCREKSLIRITCQLKKLVANEPRQEIGGGTSGRDRESSGKQ